LKEKLKELLNKLESGKLAPFVQFVKFGLVGVCNTAIQWGGNQLGYYVLFKSISNEELNLIPAIGLSFTVRSIPSILLGFTLSVINSYFWNNKFVFKSDHKKTFGEHVKAFLKMTASYALSTLILTWIITNWIESMGVPYWIASLVPLVVTVPLNFFMNKLWVFRDKKGQGENDEEKADE